MSALRASLALVLAALAVAALIWAAPPAYANEIFVAVEESAPRGRPLPVILRAGNGGPA